MKAVFFTKFGGPEVLEYGEFPSPQPQPGEALVRVQACGLNHLDVWLRKGRSNIILPHIPGCDVAGVIEEINGVCDFKQGQEVVVNPAIPCGTCSRCVAGDDCELVVILGARVKGGYAEYITVPMYQLYAKPQNLSAVEAAAFPLTFLTAWHMLVGRAELKKSETVFVWGASGGLGSAAVQIANYLGAKVIAAAKSEAEAQRLRELGAHEVAIYTQNKVGDVVKAFTEQRGVDAVFESVGKETWATTLAILRPLGRVVIAGTTSGDVIALNLSDIYVRQLTILGARMGTRTEFEKVLELVQSGVLKPIVDSVFLLSEAAAAQRRMEKREHFGKIVLKVSD